MTINLPALISFVLVTTFTPGPANVASASMGLLLGYRGALGFLGGLATGVFAIMFLSGLASSTVLNLLPVAEPILRLIGAGYILYLAYAVLKTSYAFDQTGASPMGYSRGLLLQVLNPKLFVYALTLFSTFLGPLTNNPVGLFMAACLLGLTAFCATSTWALFGTAIKNHLHHERLKLGLNIVLSLTLVYAALEIVGVV